MHFAVASKSPLVPLATMTRRSALLGSKSITTSEESNLEIDLEVPSHDGNESAGDYLSDVDEKSTSKTLKKRKRKSTTKQADSDALQKVKPFRGMRGKLRQLP